MKSFFNTTNFRLFIQACVTGVVFAMWGYVQLFMLRATPPSENHDFIIRMLGMLDGILVTAAAFWLGTSTSSQAKDEKK